MNIHATSPAIRTEEPALDGEAIPEKPHVRSGLSAHYLFLLIAPFIYAAYALLTPPFQSPDEHQHLFRAWQLSQGQLIGVRHGHESGGVLPDALGRAALPELGTLDPHAQRAIVRRPLGRIFSGGTAATEMPVRFFNFFGSVIYSPTGYVPQLAAIWVGKATGLSVEDIVRLGRLLNATLAILLIFAAMRITPVGAMGMAWVGLFPMTAAAASSLGQDGLVIGGTCLLTAVGLKVVQSGVWTRSEALGSAVVGVAVALAKVTYVPLALIGGAPFAYRKLEGRRLLTALAITALAFAVAIAWLHAVSGLMLPTQADVPPAGQRLAEFGRDPATIVSLLGQTYARESMHILESLFEFGWRNILVYAAAIPTAVALLLVMIDERGSARGLDLPARLWLLFIAASIILLISAAMFFSSTRASSPVIEGLQGRYFLPVVPLILLATLPVRSGTRRYSGLIAMLMIGANLIVFEAIFRAFYR